MLRAPKKLGFVLLTCKNDGRKYVSDRCAMAAARASPAGERQRSAARRPARVSAQVTLACNPPGAWRPQSDG